MRNFDVKQFSSDKILKHLDRVNAWLKGENPPPITVELDMTNMCNHKCPECVVNYFRREDKSFLNKKFATNVIKQLAQADIRGLIFTGGGEPLSNPATIDMVKLAHDLGLDLGFITNGSLINEEAAKAILKNCTWVRVSLDAGSEKTFSLTHGMDGKEFRRIINNIKLLSRLKRKIRSKCTIGVGYLTSKDTAFEMEKAAILCRDLGVDYLQFRPMQIRRGNKFSYSWTNVDMNIENCLNYSNDNYKVLFSKHKYDMMKRKDYGRFYKKCYGHQFATVVAADGKLYVCCHLRGFDKYCIGDLRKNSFEEIWNSNRREKIVNNIDFKDCIPLCRDNTFNQILWNIKQPREHVNFL